MPYCQSCGRQIKENSRFCPNCGKEIVVNPVIAKRLEEPEIIKEIPHKSSSGWGVLIAILIIVGIIIAIVIIAQQGAFSSGGGISKIIDPCERQFDTCNRECGEGWGSGLCKTACTVQYNDCKSKR